MSNDVKIIKRKKISGVVIKPENIRELGERIYEEYTQDLEKNQNTSSNVTFILKGSDDTQYESSSTRILSEGGILDTRRITAMEMSYYNYSRDKRVSIDAEHDTSGSWGPSRAGQIIVSGKDEIWTSGLMKWIEDAILNWQKQKKWPYKCAWFLAGVFTAGIALLLYRIATYIKPLSAPYIGILLAFPYLYFFLLGS